MKNKLNACELDIIYSLLDKKVDNLNKEMSSWWENGEETPEYLQEMFTEYNDLRNKIYCMMNKTHY